MNQPELCVEKSIYSKPFPNFQKPKIIGFIDIEHLKYAREISERKVSYNLNVLMDKVKRKPPDRDVKLTELLKFLLEHEKRLNFPPQKKLDHAPFFCYRGLMTCVACTPYENKDPWKIVAILFKGNIYLCARDTEEKIKQKMNCTEKDKQFTSWGYKFEQYILSDTPDSEPNPNIPVDENEEFSLVFSTQLNQHRIIYGAEMDGIRCGESPVLPLAELTKDPEEIISYLTSKDFIELKTNRHIEFAKQRNSFNKFKTKKWWCQSFLVGINTILCGFRNDDGIVEELKLFKVNDLPKLSKGFWNPNVCFNFLDTFFIYVKRCLARKISNDYGPKALENIQNLPLTTLLFEWSPYSAVCVRDYYSHEDDPILLDWFVQNFGKMNKEEIM